MTLIISFLQNGHLPQDVEEARKVRKRTARFTILNDSLYKRGFSIVNEKEANIFWKRSMKGFVETMQDPGP